MAPPQEPYELSNGTNGLKPKQNWFDEFNALNVVSVTRTLFWVFFLSFRSLNIVLCLNNRYQTIADSVFCLYSMHSDFYVCFCPAWVNWLGISDSSFRSFYCRILIAIVSCWFHMNLNEKIFNDSEVRVRRLFLNIFMSSVFRWNGSYLSMYAVVVFCYHNTLYLCQSEPIRTVWMKFDIR